MLDVEHTHTHEAKHICVSQFTIYIYKIENVPTRCVVMPFQMTGSSLELFKLSRVSIHSTHIFQCSLHPHNQFVIADVHTRHAYALRGLKGCN